VCWVVIAKHGLFAIQSLESLIMQSGIELVKFTLQLRNTDLSLNVENCFSSALSWSEAILFLSTVGSDQH